MTHSPLCAKRLGDVDALAPDEPGWVDQLALDTARLVAAALPSARPEIRVTTAQIAISRAVRMALWLGQRLDAAGV